MLAYDQKFYLFTQELDVGLLVIQDQFSAFGQNTNKYMLTASYLKTIKNHNIRGGVQLGFINRSTDLGKQTFPNQWVYENGSFDQNVNNGEGGLIESQNFFDINAGLSWSTNQYKLNPTVGVAFFHINTPEDSYYKEAVEPLKMRSLIHAGLEISLTESLIAEPKLAFMWTGKAQSLMIGGNIKKELGYDGFNQLFAGVQYRDGIDRIGDAIIPIVGVGYKDFKVGFSYDVNTSSLSDYSGRKGTYELSLIYTAPAFIPKVKIPCERY